MGQKTLTSKLKEVLPTFLYCINTYPYNSGASPSLSTRGAIFPALPCLTTNVVTHVWMYPCAMWLLTPCRLHGGGDYMKDRRNVLMGCQGIAGQRWVITTYIGSYLLPTP